MNVKYILQKQKYSVVVYNILRWQLGARILFFNWILSSPSCRPVFKPIWWNHGTEMKVWAAVIRLYGRVWAPPLAANFLVSLLYSVSQIKTHVINMAVHIKGHKHSQCLAVQHSRYSISARSARYADICQSLLKVHMQLMTEDRNPRCTAILICSPWPIQGLIR